LVILSVPISRELALDGLTAAESEVARLVLEGLSNRQIAKQRAIALSTVRKHLETIYRKLGVRSRSELAALDARRRRS
jgi:DNA-binding CsgD family transcriptional regulator